MSSEPHAALAWAGASLFLPIHLPLLRTHVLCSNRILTSNSQLLLNPSSQRTAAIDGLETIPFIIRRYKVIERLRRPGAANVSIHQSDDTKELVDDLEKKIIRLYAGILSFQIRLMRQFSRNWAHRYGRDTFKVDD